MIYVVSGIHRSGTSMMMNILTAGGIKPYWSRMREKQMKHGDAEYQINPNEFYEVGQSEYMRFGFTSKLPDDCCVKIQAIGLPILASGKCYKIIYMRRDPEAIEASYKAAFPHDDFDKKYPSWPSYYWELLENVKGIMQDRRSVELIELWYDDVIENPEKAIDILISHGLPFDKQKALQVIDPNHRRFVA